MPEHRQRPENLNEAVRGTLVEWVLEERLRPGDRFNESQIGESLGVSQTPVREALFRLAGEGVVTAERGKGFRLRDLDERGFRDLHGLVAGLETLAFRACPEPEAGKIRELRRVNRLFAEARSRRRAVILDHDWHFALVHDCGNRFLLEKLRSAKILTFSYALAYWDLIGTLSRSVEEHDRIIDALESDALGEAERLIVGNWLNTTQVLLDSLESRERGPLSLTR